MKIKYDNSERLETVSDKQWREALDHLTAYLRWRLKGRTRRGAHSEKALGMPAIEYYEEMAVEKLIEMHIYSYIFPTSFVFFCGMMAKLNQYADGSCVQLMKICGIFVKHYPMIYCWSWNIGLIE